MSFPLILTGFLAILSSCGTPKPVSETEFLLGTTCSITLFQTGKTDAMTAAFERVREIEETMSVSIDSSDTAAINAAAGSAPVQVGESILDLLEGALDIAEETGGAFDPTVGPLVAAWGIGTETAAVPDPETIEGLLGYVGYRRIAVDTGESMVFLPEPGMGIDLGAIAKGYAADEAAEQLMEGGIKRGIVDFGGNIKVFGEKKNGDPWRIGIQTPHENRGRYFGIVEIESGSVVSSGTYERFFIEDGVRYHHILDPVTGYPADNGLESVTIVTEEATLADAYSTAVFVLGLEAGIDFIAEKPGVDAIFVTREQNVHITRGLKDRFSLTSGDYELITD